MLTKLQDDKINSLLADSNNRWSVPKLFIDLTQDITDAFILWDMWFKANHSHCKEPYTFYTELKSYCHQFYVSLRTLIRKLDKWVELGWLSKQQRNVYRKIDGKKEAFKNTFITFNRDTFFKALYDQNAKMTFCSEPECQNDILVDDQSAKMAFSLLTDTSLTDTSVTDAVNAEQDLNNELCEELVPPDKSLQQTSTERIDLIKLERQAFKSWCDAESSQPPAVNQLMVMAKCRNDADVVKIYNDKKLYLMWNSFDEFFSHLSAKALERCKMRFTVSTFKQWLSNEKPVSIEKAKPEDGYNIDQKMRYRDYRSVRLSQGLDCLGIADWFLSGEPAK